MGLKTFKLLTTCGKEKLFLVLEGVSDRNSETRGPGSAELDVVVDQVHVRLRTDKYGPRYIHAKSGAELSEKMIAAAKVCASGKRAGEVRGIKTNALRSDPGGQFRLGAFPYRRRKHRVYVIKKRAEWLKAQVKVLLGAKRSIESNSQVMEEEKIQSNRGIGSTADGRDGIAECIGGGGWTGQAGHSERQVKLLRLRSASTQEKQTR